MVASPAARPDAIRRHNLALVLGHIHRDGALTRAELTQRLAVSRSTMGALVSDLLALRLVDEVVPSGGSSVGRPSHVVGPHDGGPYVVAVDIDVTHVATATVGLGGVVLSRRVVPTTETVVDPARTVALVRESIEAICRETGRVAGPVAVGVSVPGTVDRETGHVTVAPNLDWHDVPFASMLAAVLPVAPRICVGNDANLAVLAEHLRGTAQGFDDVVYLIGRVGVGAGIVINGAPLRGYDGHAGEIGHNVIDSAGPPCHCGKTGCIETYIGEAAFLALAGRALPPTDEAMDALFADARAGEAAALAAVRSVAEPLGRTIATLVNILNPQRVLLGGTLSHLLDIARPDVEAALEHYALASQGRSVQLIQPRFGMDSPLMGAAEVAFAELLSDPLGTSAGVL